MASLLRRFRRRSALRTARFDRPREAVPAMHADRNAVLGHHLPEFSFVPTSPDTRQDEFKQSRRNPRPQRENQDPTPARMLKSAAKSYECPKHCRKHGEKAQKPAPSHRDGAAHPPIGFYGDLLAKLAVFDEGGCVGALQP